MYSRTRFLLPQVIPVLLFAGRQLTLNSTEFSYVLCPLLGPPRFLAFLPPPLFFFNRALDEFIESRVHNPPRDRPFLDFPPFFFDTLSPPSHSFWSMAEPQQNPKRLALCVHLSKALPTPPAGFPANDPPFRLRYGGCGFSRYMSAKLLMIFFPSYCFSGNTLFSNFSVFRFAACPHLPLF